MLLVDEIQGTTGEQISSVLLDIHPRRIFGYTATDKGMFNCADKVLKGLFGERLVYLEYPEAEEIKAVVPCTVYFVDMPTDIILNASTVPGKISQGIKNCTVRHELIAEVCRSIPNGWQTIIFVDHIQDHLVKLYKAMPPGTRYVHRGTDAGVVGEFAMSQKKQAEVIRAFCNNEFQFLIATDAFRAGFDVQNCRVVIQAAGGTSEVEILQEAFRGSRALSEETQKKLNVEPKTHFVLVDIMDRHDQVLEGHSHTRLEIYRRQGWKVKRVKTVAEIDWNDFDSQS